ncbi:MAG: hypothetical protein ACREMQ_10145, partial [Longimicrobiales bacterium]
MVSAALPRASRDFLFCSTMVLLVGCSDERARPDPVEVTTAQLTVEVLEPRQNATVIAGRDIVVRVSARDLGGDNLAGVGFIVRRAATSVDSLALPFAPTRERTEDFTFRVPAQLPTNTQLDVFGLALGPRSQSRLSTPRSVVVVQCEPG